MALNAGARPLVDVGSDEQAGNHRPGNPAGQNLSRHVERSEDRSASRPAAAGPPEFDFVEHLDAGQSWCADDLRRRQAQPDLRSHARELIIGVSGGIAAYKTAALVSSLVQQGHGVSVVMTRAARKFVGPATFRALTGRPVASDVVRPRPLPARRPHRTGRARPTCCASPRRRPTSWPKPLAAWRTTCSARCCCRFGGPVLFAPAMNSAMWEKPAVQRNVATLRGDGCPLRRPARRLAKLPPHRHGPHGRAGRHPSRDRTTAQ